MATLIYSQVATSSLKQTQKFIYNNQNAARHSRQVSIQSTLILKRWPLTRPTDRLASRPYRHRHSPGSTICAAPAAAAAAAAALTAAPPTSTPELALLAVIVGWLVIAGSTIRSLPQILRILKNKSVSGLSITSFLSELLAYTITVSYNARFQYPFSTFGDIVMCWLQNLVIIGLIFHYRAGMSKRSKLIIGSIIAAGVGWLFSGSCPENMLVALQALSVVILALGGRLPQILLNMKRGNSGELSAASTGLSFVGNVARVFTTITLVGDRVILAGAASQMVLNGILVLQCWNTARAVRRVTISSASGTI